jgi:hypothetical protein
MGKEKIPLNKPYAKLVNRRKASRFKTEEFKSDVYKSLTQLLKAYSD